MHVQHTEGPVDGSLYATVTKSSKETKKETRSTTRKTTTHSSPGLANGGPPALQNGPLRDRDHSALSPTPGHIGKTTAMTSQSVNNRTNAMTNIAPISQKTLDEQSQLDEILNELLGDQMLTKPTSSTAVRSLSPSHGSLTTHSGNSRTVVSWDTSQAGPSQGYSVTKETYSRPDPDTKTHSVVSRQEQVSYSGPDDVDHRHKLPRDAFTYGGIQESSKKVESTKTYTKRTERTASPPFKERIGSPVYRERVGSPPVPPVRNRVASPTYYSPVGSPPPTRPYQTDSFHRGYYSDSEDTMSWLERQQSKLEARKEGREWRRRSDQEKQLVDELRLAQTSISRKRAESEVKEREVVDDYARRDKDVFLQNGPTYAINSPERSPEEKHVYRSISHDAFNRPDDQYKTERNYYVSGLERPVFTTHQTKYTFSVSPPKQAGYGDTITSKPPPSPGLGRSAPTSPLIPARNTSSREAVKTRTIVRDFQDSYAGYNQKIEDLEKTLQDVILKTQPIQKPTPPVTTSGYDANDSRRPDSFGNDSRESRHTESSFESRHTNSSYDASRSMSPEWDNKKGVDQMEHGLPDDQEVEEEVISLQPIGPGLQKLEPEDGTLIRSPTPSYPVQAISPPPQPQTMMTRTVMQKQQQQQQYNATQPPLQAAPQMSPPQVVQNAPQFQQSPNQPAAFPVPVQEEYIHKERHVRREESAPAVPVQTYPQQQQPQQQPQQQQQQPVLEYATAPHPGSQKAVQHEMYRSHTIQKQYTTGQQPGQQPQMITPQMGVQAHGVQQVQQPVQPAAFPQTTQMTQAAPTQQAQVTPILQVSPQQQAVTQQVAPQQMNQFNQQQQVSRQSTTQQRHVEHQYGQPVQPQQQQVQYAQQQQQPQQQFGVQNHIGVQQVSPKHAGIQQDGIQQHTITAQHRTATQQYGQQQAVPQQVGTQTQVTATGAQQQYGVQQAGTQQHASTREMNTQTQQFVQPQDPSQQMHLQQQGVQQGGTQGGTQQHVTKQVTTQTRQFAHQHDQPQQVQMQQPGVQQIGTQQQATTRQVNAQTQHHFIHPQDQVQVQQQGVQQIGTQQQQATTRQVNAQTQQHFIHPQDQVQVQQQGVQQIGTQQQQATTRQVNAQTQQHFTHQQDQPQQGQVQQQGVQQIGTQQQATSRQVNAQTQQHFIHQQDQPQQVQMQQHVQPQQMGVQQVGTHDIQAQQGGAQHVQTQRTVQTRHTQQQFGQQQGQQQQPIGQQQDAQLQLGQQGQEQHFQQQGQVQGQVQQQAFNQQQIDQQQQQQQQQQVSQQYQTVTKQHSSGGMQSQQGGTMMNGGISGQLSIDTSAGQRNVGTGVARSPPYTGSVFTPPSPGGFSYGTMAMRTQSGAMTPGFTGQSSPSIYTGTSRRGSFSSMGEGGEILHHTPRFVRDTSKFWYKPHISREDAINLLRDKPAGIFVVRDSNSFPGAFGLALKVAQVPPNVQTKGGDPDAELVRHFLIEPTPKGVKLKGCSNEPVFGSLAALVYQHSITPLALPCKLHLPESESGDFDSIDSPSSATQLLSQGAACNVLYISSLDMESLTGPEAVSKAIQMTTSALPAPKTTTVHFKVSSQGVTLTDSKRKLFFRRHYPVSAVTFCGMDPEDRRWTQKHEESGIPLNAKIFGFVARKPGSLTDNACHLFAELDPDQPASAIVNFVTKVMIGQGRIMKS